ncbi:hypothetical protein HPP92_023776 [Vanilla planifolia]|uniref:Bicarbonate transporter-like transmembrane domain-containing protein n=1 Tax=Vanilla planifolia TaxID=51239 RepID=A0A835PRH9_VANPL|nr:hypothetical protein HPP92_023776 [Vanilla planifolia]
MAVTAKESIQLQASNSEMYGKMQEVFIEMDKSNSARTITNEWKDLKEVVMTSGEINGAFDPEKHIDAHLPVRVKEQRVSNLCQSILVGGCLGAIPLIMKIPISVLWGYFAYMAIDSLPGNQFWERLLLLFITPGRRYKVLEGAHASFVESVSFRVIATFTIFQLAYFLICFGVTWIPIAGILFPLPFFLLISIREHLLLKFFHQQDLWDLDAAEYEEIAGVPNLDHILSFRELMTVRKLLMHVLMVRKFWTSLQQAEGSLSSGQEVSMRKGSFKFILIHCRRSQYVSNAVSMQEIALLLSKLEVRKWFSCFH